MKKVFALILSVVMIMSLFAGCGAQGTPAETGKTPVATEAPEKAPAVEEEATEAAEVEEAPEVPEEDENAPQLTEESYENVKVYSDEAVSELPEDIQNRMAEAAEALKSVDSQGLAKRFFFYMDILNGKDSATVEFAPIPHNVLMFMQYLDGQWVTAEHTIDEEGIITVNALKGNAIVIFADPLYRAGATWAELVPVLTQEAQLIAQIHTVEEVESMPAAIYNQMVEAKYLLKDACPEGFAVKYFFYMELLNGETSATVDFGPIEHNEILFIQFVDGAWVELEYTEKADGVLSVAGVVNAPIAVLVK